MEMKWIGDAVSSLTLRSGLFVIFAQEAGVLYFGRTTTQLHFMSVGFGREQRNIRMGVVSLGPRLSSVSRAIQLI